MTPAIRSDIHTAARAVRSNSWPGDMAEHMEQLANRLDAYADRPPHTLLKKTTAELADNIARRARDWHNRYPNVDDHETVSLMAEQLYIVDLVAQTTP